MLQKEYKKSFLLIIGTDFLGIDVNMSVLCIDNWFVIKCNKIDGTLSFPTLWV